MTDADGPTGDDLVIGIPLRPVRFKAPRARKQALDALIKQHTSKEAFLLTGEVKVDIEWMCFALSSFRQSFQQLSVRTWLSLP